MVRKKSLSQLRQRSVKDVTGAGDSFCAAVVYSWLNGMSTEDILIAGMVMQENDRNEIYS